MLTSLEQSEQSPMPGAFRSEALVQLRMFRHVPLRRAWPWWDGKLTERWIVRMAKVQIYLAQLPFGRKLFAETPEQRFFRENASGSSYGWILQYNGLGLRFLGMASPAGLKFILKWHQHRCLAAALRAAVARHLQADRQIRTLKLSTPLVRPIAVVVSRLR